MTEADVLRSAQEAATWHYFNQPQMAQDVLAMRAEQYVLDELYGDGGLPTITPDVALCPTCWTQLQLLQGAQMWRCAGCNVLLTPNAVKHQ